MKIGVICPSEIALRRFMPALQLLDELEFAGVGVCTQEERFMKSVYATEEIKCILESEKKKAEAFIETYGGRLFNGYQEMVESDEIDAIYIPLPPALHYKWAKSALENGKHVLVEKPSTIHSEDTKKLVELADKNGLALHENYMFVFHKQLEEIQKIIMEGEVGNVRLHRIFFGFPRRKANDFRYDKALGGGALIDAGGYALKYATKILGDSAKIEYAKMNYCEGTQVDMYGSAALVNEDGLTVQVAFGMDNNYKCELEVWGSEGTLHTGRIFTAPTGFSPTVTIQKGNVIENRTLSEDDAFKKSIEYFLLCVQNSSVRKKTYREMIQQAMIVDSFRDCAK